MRLAVPASEVRRAQALRYRVFYEEMSAVADFRTRQTRRDADRFDRFCDHLLVIDHARKSRALGRPAEIVGTYRLLRQDVAEDAGGFYSAGEFDLAPLLRRKPGLNGSSSSAAPACFPNIATSGRSSSCGTASGPMCCRHGVDVMIGCASLEGTDPEKLALPLSFLHHHCRAPEEWRVARARATARRDEPHAGARRSTRRRRSARCRRSSRDICGSAPIVGDGAVIDRQFGTIDVAIVLPVAAIAARYVELLRRRRRPLCRQARAEAGRRAARRRLIRT